MGTKFCNIAFKTPSWYYTSKELCLYSSTKHKHLLQLVRALLFQSHLPKFIWDHAILMVTYIVDRFPCSILNWKTLYSFIYHKHLDYSTLKCFGCLCFATNTQPHKDKFTPWASKCIFLGFQSGFKAYK